MKSFLIVILTVLSAADIAPAESILPPNEISLKSVAEYSMAHKGQTMLVLFDGKCVYEQYANGGSANRLQMLASGSKSFVGAVAAAAVSDGIIRFDDPVCETLVDWKNDPLKSKITYRQLLSLSSGLAAGERGMSTRAPTWKDIAGKPMSGKPGEQFSYGAYHLNAFAYALEQKLGKETFEAYLKRRILDPLGINIEWRFKCDDGHPQVGGGAFMTARDWAKFGEFIRLGGQSDEKQIVSPAVLAECFKGSSQNPAYGLTWWLKNPVSDKLRKEVPILSSEWGDAANSTELPGDLVAACGAGKQRLYVIPSLKLVIVRQGTMSRDFSDTKFLLRLLGKEDEK